MRGFSLAIAAFFKVPSATIRYRLIRYHMLTGLIGLLLGAILLSGSYGYGDDLGQWVISWLPWTGSSIVTDVGSWVGRISVFLLALFLYKYILIIAVSPIMSPLSERIERLHNKGIVPIKPLSLTTWIKDILRGVRISLRNIVRELSITLILLLLGFIPGLALITTPLIFVVQAYYAGFGNMDYYMERHYGVKEAAEYVRQRRGLAIGNGAVFLVVLLLPFVGYFIAPALCATAATIAILDQE